LIAPKLAFVWRTEPGIFRVALAGHVCSEDDQRKVADINGVEIGWMTEIYASGVIYGGLELVWGILGYFSGDYWYTSEVEVESSHVDPSGVDGCETWLQNGEMSTAVDLRNKKIIGWDY